MKNFLKTCLFLSLIVATYVVIIQWFGVSNKFSEHAEMMIKGYYDMEDDCTDVVVVGNSHVYRYWQPAMAWKEYGIASTAFSYSDAPPSTVKHMCIEALKTQDPDVLFIDLTPFINSKDDANNKIYLFTNNMKFSANYVATIYDYCKFSNIKGLDVVPYYISMGQFHSRWNDLKPRDFVQTKESLLNSCYQEDFLTEAIDAFEHKETDRIVENSPGSVASLNDLLDWCKKQDRKIVFFSSPCVMGGNRFAMANHIEKIIEDEGFEVLDFNEKEWYDSFGFVEGEDYQDINHVNIKGAYKFMKVFSEYMIEEYNLTDHRGEEAYKQWDIDAQRYYDIVMPYINGTVENNLVTPKYE